MKNKVPAKTAAPPKHKASGPKSGPAPQGKAKPGRTGLKRMSPVYTILVLSYAFIPVFVPNFHTFDSNGPKFLAIALLNMVSFAILLSDSNFRNKPGWQSGFFRNPIGAAFSLFLIIALLSFFNAINLVESVLSFIKLFTVFAASYLIYAILAGNRKNFGILTVALTFLLIADCLTVFYHMSLYVSREIKSIMDIESIYSHKNILTSAIFLKIPYALCLAYFGAGWKKILGYAAATAAVLAILMLSTRAFYLGSVLLAVSLAAFVMIRHLVQRRKGLVIKVAVIFGIFIVAALGYTLAQRYFFPKNTDTIWNTGIVSRLSSISTEESSANARLSSWKESFELIKRHPLLGVGTGNWKVSVLEYENQRLRGFNYSYKNHNDFIEITAETGLPGGLAFVTIIFLILLHFTRTSLDPSPGNDRLRFFFLSGFGILAYCVDAFFNFPHDRPEIQTLFAFFIATGAAAMTGESLTSGLQKSPDHRFLSNSLGYIIIVFACLFLAASIWILGLNSTSLYVQRKALEDLQSEQHTRPASWYLEKFPFVPTVTSHGEPVSVVKARFLISEKRYPEAIDLLKNDHSSPFDSGPEYYIALAYDQLGMRDSALVWGQKSHRLKPLNPRMTLSLSSWLFEKGRTEEGFRLLDEYMSKVRFDKRAWLLNANQRYLAGDYETAAALLDSAKRYFPADSAISANYVSFRRMAMITPQKDLYDKILAEYNNGKFSEAIFHLNTFIKNEPRFGEAFAYRGICHSAKGNYEQGIADITAALNLGFENYEVINLRGENYLKTGNTEKACTDFKTAADRGIEKAKQNVRNHCR